MLRTIVAIAIAVDAIIVAREGLFSHVRCSGEEQLRERQQSSGNNKSDTESISSDNTLVQPMYFNPMPIAAPFAPMTYTQQAINPSMNTLYVIQPNPAMYNNNKRRRRQRNRPVPAAGKSARPRAIPVQITPYITPVAPYGQLMGPFQGVKQVSMTQRPPNQMRGPKIYIRQVPSANNEGSQSQAVSVKNVQTVLVPINSKGPAQSAVTGISTSHPQHIVYPVGEMGNIATKYRYKLRPAYVEPQDLPNSSNRTNYATLIRPGQVLFSETDQSDTRPKLSLKDVRDIELLLRRLKPLVEMPDESKRDQAEVAQHVAHQAYRRPIVVSASVEKQQQQQSPDINYPIENQIFIAGLKHPGVQRNVNKDELAFLASLSQLKPAETGALVSRSPEDVIAEKFYSREPANNQADSKRQASANRPQEGEWLGAYPKVGL